MSFTLRCVLVLLFLFAVGSQARVSKQHAPPEPAVPGATEKTEKEDDDKVETPEDVEVDKDDDDKDDDDKDDDDKDDDDKDDDDKDDDDKDDDDKDDDDKDDSDKDDDDKDDDDKDDDDKDDDDKDDDDKDDDDKDDDDDDDDDDEDKEAEVSNETAVVPHKPSLIEVPPEECRKYIKVFLQWQIIISSHKNITWIVHMNNSKDCWKCYYGNDAEPFKDMAACKACHVPFLPHIESEPGCRDCLDEDKADKKACYKCFLNMKHNVSAAICLLHAEVQVKLDRLYLYLSGKL